jgi:hypothetical protein
LPIASAAEASTAAFEVLLLMPPEPRRKQAPARMNNIPSIAKKSESGRKRRSQKLTEYAENASIKEAATKRLTFRRLNLFVLPKNTDALPRIKSVTRENFQNQLPHETDVQET